MIGIDESWFFVAGTGKIEQSMFYLCGIGLMLLGGVKFLAVDQGPVVRSCFFPVGLYLFGMSVASIPHNFPGGIQSISVLIVETTSRIMQGSLLW